MKLAAIAWFAASSYSLGLAQVQRTEDAAAIGLAIGATAPDFSLVDQTGHRRTIDSLAGPKGLVLVFFRSADW
jgi:hypothetical protein